MLDDCPYLEKYLVTSLGLNIKNISLIFNHPKETRFKDLFETIKVKKKRKTMSVNPKKIR